jgi:hypothetical protein
VVRKASAWISERTLAPSERAIYDLTPTWSEATPFEFDGPRPRFSLGEVQSLHPAVPRARAFEGRTVGAHCLLKAELVSFPSTLQHPRDCRMISRGPVGLSDERPREPNSRLFVPLILGQRRCCRSTAAERQKEKRR